MDVDNTDSCQVNEKLGGQSNPLEQFLLLAKGAKGAAATQLVRQVLEAQGVFVFGELLICPNIAELESTHKGYYDILELFAYGIYSDYIQNSSKLPNLTEPMLNKLRLLTLVSLATGQKSLSLNSLSQELAITSTRQLEDLIIEAIYAGIISGRLDQKNGILEVDFAMGRDIKLETLADISTSLQEWCRTCDELLNSVNSEIKYANLSKDENLKHKNLLEQEIMNVKASLKAQIQDDDSIMSDFRDHDKKRPIKKPAKGTSSNFLSKKLGY